MFSIKYIIILPTFILFYIFKYKITIIIYSHYLLRLSKKKEECAETETGPAYIKWWCQNNILLLTVNTALFIQLIYQGIIENMKRQYRNAL